MYKKHYMLIAILAVAIAVATLSGVTMVSSVGSNIWVVRLSTNHLYALQKYWLFINVYNTATGVQYPVSANITITNGYVVIYHAVVSGNPLNYTLTAPAKPGTYTMYVYAVCNATKQTVSRTYTLYVEYPTPVISTLAKWREYTEINVTLPYPYNNYGTIYLDKTYYHVKITNGKAHLYIPNGLTKPVTAYWEFDNQKTYFNITPVVPKVVLGIPHSVEVTRPITVLPAFDNGLPIKYPVVITVSENATGKVVEIIHAYTNVETSFRINKYGNYTVVASYQPWQNYTVSTVYSLEVLPPALVIYNFTTNSTPWNYYLAYKVDSDIYDMPVTVTVRIDNTTYTVTGYPPLIPLDKHVVFYPGVHIVEINATQCGYTVTSKTVLVIPRHPYPMPREPSMIFIGDNIYNYIRDPNIQYVVEELDNHTLRVTLYYPGNSYYAPAKETWILPVEYPDVVVGANNKILVYNIPGNTKIIIKANNYYREIDVKSYTVALTINVPIRCEIILQHGWYTAHYYYQNNYPLVTIITPTNFAYTGEKVILVYPSPYIKSVTIDGVPYTPGTEYVFKEPGTHILVIHTVLGTITKTIIVEKPTLVVTIYRYMNLDGTISYIIVTPTSFIPVTIMFSDGSTITVHGSTSIILPSYIVPVSATSPYANINLVVEPLVK